MLKHAPVYSVIRNHIRRVNVCLAVSCHQHLWKNDRNLLRATVVPHIIIIIIIIMKIVKRLSCGSKPKDQKPCKTKNDYKYRSLFTTSFLRLIEYLEIKT